MINNLLNRCCHLLAGSSALLLVLIVLMITADVLARALADEPIRGVVEFVALSMPVLTFLALPQLINTRQLIRATVLEQWLAQREASVRLGFESLFAAVAASMLVYALGVIAPWLWRAFIDQEFVGVPGDITLSVWPAKLLVVTGVSAALLTYVHLLLGSLKKFNWAMLLPLFALLGLLIVTSGIETNALIGGIAISFLLLLLYTGLSVGFALMAAGFWGIAMIKGDTGIAAGALAMAIDGGLSSYVFAAVPMFVLMGLVLGRADIGRDSLHAAHWLLRKVAGGLGVATVVANAIFAAITGISIASAAIFSKVAVPALVEQGYRERFAVGLVAGSSVLGMLIPPSLLLIIYGLVAEVSINKLFLAAIVPGLILTLLFSLLVVVSVKSGWSFAVRDSGIQEKHDDQNATAVVLKMLPVLLLIAAVLGGIYSGLFTPTEAGAVGTVLAFVMALVMRRLDFHQLVNMTREAALSSSSILFLIVSASVFGMMLTLSGIPAFVGEQVAAAGLGLSAYCCIYLVLLIMLGMVIDSTSILLIMVPLALPTIKLLGGDLVWFGIVTVIGVEIGLLTPPLGLSVYAIKAALDDERISLNDIFMGALPSAAIMLLLTLTLITYPEITGLL